MPEVVASGARWRVERDEHGIARCVGRGLDDLAYAQGWACAHDRAWQVETDRRRSTGGLADWLGDESCRGVDELASRARLDALALRCWARLHEEEPEVAAWLQAYVDGVNDGMQVGAARSPEMAAARVQPGRWAPWSPIGVFLVNHVLFGSYPHELWREHVEGVLGERWADVLAPAHGHPALSGSNAWAVTPSRSATGAPLLAADPHRLLECPGIYQQVHLVAEEDGVDVLGLAFPGVPGVPHFGHTGDVAWVITNAMAHYQELVDDGPQVEEATDGPVVLDPVAGRPARRLRTPAWVGSRVGVRAWRDLLLAHDVEDVDAALEHWVEPVNAVLVADSTGQVLERVAGLTAAGPTTRTTRVVPDGSVAVHANHASALTAPWGRAFAPDHRARRVASLLEPHSQVTLDDCAQIQRDAVSGSWPVLRGLLARPVVGRGLDPAEAQVREELLGFDGAMVAASEGAALAARFRLHLAQAVLDDPELLPLRAETGLPPLYAPWTDPLVRVTTSLERVVERGEGLGLALEPATRAALHAVAAEGRPATWGELHRVLPLVPPGSTTPRLRTPVSGADDAVCATSTHTGTGHDVVRGPAARVLWDLGDRSRSRWVVPFGADGVLDAPHALDQAPLWAAGTTLPVPTGDPMTVTIPLPGGAAASARLLDPRGDAALVHRWVTQPRGRFWGMGDQSVEEVAQTYEYVASLPAHDAYLVHVDGRPCALVQLYDPAQDPLGEVVEVREGDLGLHLFVGPGAAAVAGLDRTETAMIAAMRLAFGRAGVRRVVAEPDERNVAMMRRLAQAGADIGERIRVHDKDARYVVLDRAAFERAEARVLAASVARV
ncbi:GNAT family N-acetyltransferase [Janibacter sp. Y6]|uniref:GNAT family N-acetyltransferase n=1 Tax=Janibacter sp. Y6 TaxID=2913552 RepID=UPI0034A4ABA1